MSGCQQNYIEELEAENARLKNLINCPEIVDFRHALCVEAAHQKERWGEEHDQNKSFSDWFMVLNYLLGKLANAYWNNDMDKVKHHVITAAAVLANFHKEITRRELLVVSGDNKNG
jgi:hypothetical protein